MHSCSLIKFRCISNCLEVTLGSYTDYQSPVLEEGFLNQTYNSKRVNSPPECFVAHRNLKLMSDVDIGVVK
jgi:hypothetical protein